ncbi:MAG: hypothetical protein GY933_24355, partial [Hyphomicrobiales bacterium]|nr:hypothetical protein [Hyphomicrobiales bacterium]
MADDNPLEAAKVSLERMQFFDVAQLPRNDLGKSFNFKEAVPHAERIIKLFQKVPLDSLSEFPLAQLN